MRDYSKRVRLNEWIKQQNADSLYLQETHFTADILVNVNWNNLAIGMFITPLAQVIAVDVIYLSQRIFSLKVLSI